ncbi:MAG: hypothetical protein JSU95_09520 [Betaproteobacteria bacterium]|nr:MAG: hypothetical protein JSU95_09520 [Betaproteobacteria bacterium]
MIKPAFFVLAFLLGCQCFAAEDCRDTNGNVVEQSQCASETGAGGRELPEEAAARVYDLNVEARFFTAIGFHKQSRERRDEIARIYDEHGLPLPDEYKE